MIGLRGCQCNSGFNFLHTFWPLGMTLTRPWSRISCRRSEIIWKGGISPRRDFIQHRNELFDHLNRANFLRILKFIVTNLIEHHPFVHRGDLLISHLSLQTQLLYTMESNYISKVAIVGVRNTTNSNNSINQNNDANNDKIPRPVATAVFT